MGRATLDHCAIEQCYATLRERIMNAEYLPNTHHLVTPIAGELRVPAIDVHYASVRLRDEGLLSLEPRGGFWVSPIDLDSIAETFRQINALESRAAYSAALHGASSLCLAALDDAVQQLHNALHSDNRVGWARSCHHFHRSLVQCSGHSDLVAEALPLSEPIHRARMVTLALGQLPVDAVQGRALIVEAIRNGAAEEARERLQAHWEAEAAVVADLLQIHRLDSLMV